MASDNLDLIVDVDITRDAPPLSQQNFNSAIFVTQDQVFAERTRVYTSAQDLLTDGFDIDSDTYKAVRTFFSQGGNVDQILVGRRDATVVELTMDSVANDTAYSITLQGTVFTFTSDSDATIAEVIDGLQGLIAADVPVSTEVVATSDSVTLTLTQQTGYTLNLKDVDLDQFNVTYATQETWAACLAALGLDNNAWYALTTYDHSVAGILAIAAVVETLNALYFVTNSNSENLETISGTPDANNIVGQLEVLEYDRTSATYSATADETYAECGWLGRKIWTLAGSTNWKYADLTGIAPDSLSPTDITNLVAANANYYITYGGSDMMAEGTVASGEWIDTMRGSDNLASDIQIAVINKLATTANRGGKVPLSERGMNQLKAVVESVCQRYVQRGFIVDTIIEKDTFGNLTSESGYSVTSALVSSLTESQRAARTAPDIQVEATLAGAVNKARVVINLFV